MLDQHASMQKPPPRRWGLLGATYVVTPRASIMQLRQFRFGAQKCTSCGRRLRTSHVCLETILPQPRYGSARSKAGDLASRQEGATAEKAVPFSKLRLSIVIQQSGVQDEPSVRRHPLKACQTAIVSDPSLPQPLDRQNPRGRVRGVGRLVGAAWPIRKKVASTRVKAPALGTSSIPRGTGEASDGMQTDKAGTITLFQKMSGTAETANRRNQPQS
jgi:hypothetical protein